VAQFHKNVYILEHTIILLVCCCQSFLIVIVGGKLFEEYLGKKVLIVESTGEKTTGVLDQIFYSDSKEVLSVKIRTDKGEVVVPFPFKLKHENGGVRDGFS